MLRTRQKTYESRRRDSDVRACHFKYSRSSERSLNPKAPQYSLGLSPSICTLLLRPLSSSLSANVRAGRATSQ